MLGKLPSPIFPQSTLISRDIHWFVGLRAGLLWNPARGPRVGPEALFPQLRPLSSWIPTWERWHLPERPQARPPALNQWSPGWGEGGGMGGKRVYPVSHHYSFLYWNALGNSAGWPAPIKGRQQQNQRKELSYSSGTEQCWERSKGLSSAGMCSADGHGPVFCLMGT